MLREMFRKEIESEVFSTSGIISDRTIDTITRITRKLQFGEEVRISDRSVDP